MEIPKQLQNDAFRFVLLGKWNLWKKGTEIREFDKDKYASLKNENIWKPLGKMPFEEAWQNNGYKYNDEKLIEHIRKGNNYGIIGGYGDLLIVDIDDKKLIEELDKKLNTFTIETGSKTRHYYLICDYKINHVLINKGGEIRANNYQVVGPNCMHPSGEAYRIIKDTDILNIPTEEFLKIFEKYISKKEEITIDFTDINLQVEVDDIFLKKNILKKLNNEMFSLICEPKTKEELKVIGFESRSERDARVITNLLLNGFGKYIKSIFQIYPIGDKYREHSNGDSYLQHTIKNSRKYTGVLNDDIIELINDIETIHSNVLRNKIDDYLEKINNINNELTKVYLISQIAFKIRIGKKDLQNRLKKIENSKKIKNPISICELMSKVLPETEYYLHPIIPKNTLILLGGKPGSFKSMFVLSLALNMKTSNSFINNFEIKENPKILLYDLENGEHIMWWRLKYLINGFNIDTNKLQDFHIEYEFNKENLEKEIELAKKYDVIILDSYRRFLDGTENDSDITDKFFNEYLQVLKKMGKTIIILHHFKKAKLEDITDEDIMDLFRGSSDIPAQFDLIMGMFKGEEIIDAVNENTIFAVQLVKVKNRLGLPIRDFNFKVEKDDKKKTTTFKFTDFGKRISPKEEAKEKILELLKIQEMPRNDIVKELKKNIKVADITVFKWLRELVDDKLIYNSKYGTYKIIGLEEEQKIKKVNPEFNQTELTIDIANEVLK